MKLLYKFKKMSNELGLRKAIMESFDYLLRKVGIIKKNMIDVERKRLSVYFNDLFESEIKYGPFKGLKLVDYTWWGELDRASILFGFYEQEVIEKIQNFVTKDKNKIFIDLGAADGYYGVGVVAAGMFTESFCFEMSPIGRESIKRLAALNNVSDKVRIYGEAKSNFLDLIPKEKLFKSIMLVDIEGAEFEVLTEEVFTELKKSIIIVEIHDFYFNNPNEKKEKLVKNSIKTHRYEEIKTGFRDLSKYPELRNLHDNSRWLLCSEGRRCLMTWYIFIPNET